MPRSTRNSSRLVEQQDTPPAATTTNRMITPSTHNNKRPAAAFTADSFRHYWNGMEFASYQDMVRAKRKRNANTLHQIVQELGRTTVTPTPPARQRQRGLQATTQTTTTVQRRRQSSRLQGIAADPACVEDEKGGVVRIAQGTTADTSTTVVAAAPAAQPVGPLSYAQAVQACAERWRPSDTTSSSSSDMDPQLRDVLVSAATPTPRHHSHTTTASSITESSIANLQIDDDPDQCVAKVCPGRIYSMAIHPTTDATLVAAGDKEGYIGLWKQQQQRCSTTTNDDDDRFVLVRPHTSPVSCLQWIDGGGLLSTSYDGTVRLWDVAHDNTFRPLFCAYPKEEQYRSHVGYGVDTGSSKCWVQYAVAADNGNNLYLSTSTGRALQIDTRSETVVFHHELSEKKINTVR